MSGLDTATVLREACRRHPPRSAEHDVEHPRKAARTDIGRRAERGLPPPRQPRQTVPHHATTPRTCTSDGERQARLGATGSFPIASTSSDIGGWIYRCPTFCDAWPVM